MRYIYSLLLTFTYYWKTCLCVYDVVCPGNLCILEQRKYYLLISINISPTLYAFILISYLESFAEFRLTNLTFDRSTRFRTWQPREM